MAVIERTDTERDTERNGNGDDGGIVELIEEVVSDLEAIVRSERYIGHGALLGVLIAVPGFILGVGLIGLAFGLGTVNAFAIGGFTAIWGGIGFGAMCGAVAAYNRDQARSGRPH